MTSKKNIAIWNSMAEMNDMEFYRLTAFVPDILYIV